MTAMKSELCVCGHEARAHDLSFCVVEATGCAGACGMCAKDACDHFDPAALPYSGFGVSVADVMEHRVFGPDGKLHDLVHRGPPAEMKLIPLAPSGVIETKLLPHQCQADWPGVYELRVQHDSRSYGKFEFNEVDLNAEKPNRPTEPLLDCPGSCTEPEYAHRGNVVCSTDESRRLIE